MNTAPMSNQTVSPSTPQPATNPPTQAAPNTPSTPASQDSPPPPSSQTEAPKQTQSKPSPEKKTNSPTPSQELTDSLVKKKIKRRTVIYLTLCSLFISGIIAINYYTKNQLKTIQLNKQQILSTQANNQFLQQASGFVANRQEQMEYILESLPTETTLIDFIKSVETVAQNHSTSSTIDFDARSPSGNEGEKYIPLTINIATDSVNFSEFLIKLEKLPYLLQVAGIEANLISGTENIWQYTLQARVFVSDEFYQKISEDL